MMSTSMSSDSFVQLSNAPRVHHIPAGLLRHRKQGGMRQCNHGPAVRRDGGEDAMSTKSDSSLQAKPQASKVLGGFAEFLKLEIAGSVFLLGATVLALVIANSPAHATLESLLHVQIGVEIGSWDFAQSIKHWIDDGLMAIFFFVIGLEVKREMVAGELSKPRQALLPVIAAVGGMLVPAVIYLVFNAGGDGARGPRGARKPGTRQPQALPDSARDCR
jgi:hypothetical protein